MNQRSDLRERVSAGFFTGLFGLASVLAGCSGPGAADGVIAAVTQAAVQPRNAAGQGSAHSTGEQLMEQGRYEQAVDEFTRALAAGGFERQSLNVFEQGADLYYRRGVAYLKMGFPDTAAADLNEAVKLAPHHGSAYEARGRAYLALGDSFKAVRDLTQAIRLKVVNGEAYQARGQTYLKRGQYDRAVADFEQALREDPTLADSTRDLLSEAYLGWSQQLAAEGDQVLAAEKLAKAREFNSAYVDRKAAPATVAEPAPPAEQTVAKPVVDGADELLAQGRMQQQNGQNDQALISYTRAIALRPELAEAYLRRGEALLSMGFPDTAIEDLKRASYRSPSAHALRLQAEAFLQLGSPHRASLAATEALHADPSHAGAYALRGRAYLALENWERCINDLDEAIRREPALQPQLSPLVEQARQGQEQARRRRMEEQRERIERDAAPNET